MRRQGPLPIERVAGTPEQIGAQLGTLYRSAIRLSCELTLRAMPLMSKAEVRAHLDFATKALKRDFPEVYAEMVATAEAAGVRFDTYLLSLYEELWDNTETPPVTRGCTDFAARGAATLTGELLVGHNNDMGTEPYDPVLVEYAPVNGIPFYAFSIDGFTASVACNKAGLVLTGNEITATDVKPGIPRLVMMRLMAGVGSMDEAARLCAYGDRASSYNNILSDSTGAVRNLEGTATKLAEVPMVDDLLVHTNHHLVFKELAVEPPTPSSDYRLRRATFLLEEGRGQHTVDTFKAILSDHRRGEDGICRHGQNNIASKFSTVFQPEQGLVHYCMGAPCLLPYLTFRYT